MNYQPSANHSHTHYIRNYLSKAIILFAVGLFLTSPSKGQEGAGKFYVGASYGRSFSIGDFADTNTDNFDAGFAANGQKIDLYGGFFLDDVWTLTATFRYQSFETEIEEAIEQYTTENPGITFSGNSGEWETYYLLVGAAYKVPLTPKFALYPRVAIGPMWATNPGVSIAADDPTLGQSYSRSSETGLGFGGEIGIGLRKDLGRHFSLMPTFTLSGGFVNYSNVETTRNNVNLVNTYEPMIQSLTLGMSMAYRFY